MVERYLISACKLIVVIDYFKTFVYIRTREILVSFYLGDIFTGSLYAIFVYRPTIHNHRFTQDIEIF